MKDAVRSWLDNVVDVAGGEIKAMLQFVSSVESLKRVQEAVLEIVGEEKLPWAGGLSVWELIFRGLISQRMIEIVTSQLELTMEVAAQDVESLITEEEESLEFIWTDNSAEIGEVWGKGKSEKVGLKMKCSGWSVRLQDIVTRLDNALEKLLHCLEADTEILAHCSLVTSNSALRLLEQICDVSLGRPVMRYRVAQAVMVQTACLARLLGDKAVQLQAQAEEMQRVLLAEWSKSLLSSRLAQGSPSWLGCSVIFLLLVENPPLQDLEQLLHELQAAIEQLIGVDSFFCLLIRIWPQNWANSAGK